MIEGTENITESKKKGYLKISLKESTEENPTDSAFEPFIPVSEQKYCEPDIKFVWNNVDVLRKVDFNYNKELYSIKRGDNVLVTQINEEFFSIDNELVKIENILFSEDSFTLECKGEKYDGIIISDDIIYLGYE